VRLLLDTNILIWWLFQSRNLTREVFTAIHDPDNTTYVSVASAWEMAIKVATKRLAVPPDLASWLPAEIDRQGFTTLSVDLHHVLAIETLPRLHRDPFDRLLVAQAQAHRLTIATADRVFAAYGVDHLPCW